MPTVKKIPIRLTSLLAFIFFFSGFAALMYQVAWQRLLTVYYGVGSISITLIVSVYMFGLGLGALFGGFLAERSKNKIILYFIVELLIGCFGLISLPFLDFLGKYTAGSNYLLSLLYIFIFIIAKSNMHFQYTKLYNRFYKKFPLVNDKIENL